MLRQRNSGEHEQPGITAREIESPDVSPKTTPNGTLLPKPANQRGCFGERDINVGGLVADMKESLVQTGTFGQSKKAKRAELCARCLMFLLYVFVSVGISVLIFTYLSTGRLDLQTNWVTYSKLEAPSIALCPAKYTSLDTAADASVLPPEKLDWEAGRYEIVVKHAKGLSKLKMKPEARTFQGKTCAVLNMFEPHPDDPLVKGFTPNMLNPAPYMLRKESDEQSQERTDFLELRTDISLLGDFDFLEVGLFNSKRHKLQPSWVYVDIGTITVGTVAIARELLPAIDIGSLIDRLRPSQIAKSVIQSVDNYSFTSLSQIKGGGEKVKPQTETRFVVEYGTFMVPETYQPKSKISVTALAILVLACVAMLNNINIFNIAFPVDTGANTKRHVSSFIKMLSCGMISEDDKEELAEQVRHALQVHRDVSRSHVGSVDVAPTPVGPYGTMDRTGVSGVASSAQV